MGTKFLADDLMYNTDGSCWQFVPVYSEGIWNLEPGEDILKHTLLRLYVQLTIIFILSSTIHLFLRPYGLPRLVSEILTGIILGPSVMGYYWPNASEVVFPPDSNRILYSLTTFGYVFFMFLMGVKMDVNLIKKSGKREWYISIILMFNMIMVTRIAKYINKFMDNRDPIDPWVGFFTGTLMLASFPVVACLLMHLKIINSELGHLALSTALLSDLLSMVIVNLNDFANIMLQASLRAGIKSIFLSLSLIVFIWTILKRFLFWIIRRTPEGQSVKTGYIIVIAFLTMFVAIIAENAGMQYLYAPFIFGLAVPTGPPLASTLVEKLDTIISGLFLPLMATFCGFETNLWEFSRLPPYALCFAMTLGPLFKMCAVYLPAVWFNMKSRDAATFSLILSAKGIVELGAFGTNTNKKTINDEQFAVSVIVILVMATIVPLFVRSLHDSSKLYPGYQQRNIMHSASNDDLRVLVCTHRQDDALAAIKLLEVSHPTKESPLSIFGLYLEPLRGGSTPLIINHQLGQNSSKSDCKRWQPIIHVFKYFKAEHPTFVQVQVFSAISPPKVMHEDICWVAFDKSISLIVLPFHRKWNAKGELISDSQALRGLNSKVLKRSPSSVGILIDRSQIRGPSSIFCTPSVYRVALLYIGGEDDMEALAYAKRMARCSRVHLTVIRFVLSDECEHTWWKNTLADEIFSALKKKDKLLGNANVTYREEIVRDGVDTAKIIQSVGDDYDLVLLGRRHRSDSPITLGLSEWCDLPELGPIGDLFASTDITTSASVLVIQQQIIEE